MPSRPDICLTQLSTCVPGHWTPFAYALRAIQAFSVEHEPDRDVEALIQRIRLAWVEDLESIGVYIVTEKDRFLPLLGHLLLTIDEDVHGRHGYLWQANLCRGIMAHMTRYYMEDALRSAKLWCRDRGLNRLVLSTERNPQAFARKYGFRVQRTIMEMEV